MAAMADMNDAPRNGYHPEMDGGAHETTYNGFVHFTTVSTVVIVCWVIALALGGVKGAWTTAIIGVLLSGAAGAVGGIAPSIGWRAPGVVLGLLLVLLVLY